MSSSLWWEEYVKHISYKPRKSNDSKKKQYSSQNVSNFLLDIYKQHSCVARHLRLFDQGEKR